MKRGLWLFIGIIISILFFACDEDATEPENGDNLNKQNFMEITIGENKFEVSYNSNEIWISSSLFGPAILSDSDPSWPDSNVAIALGVYLSNFPFSTGIEQNTVIDLANNTSGIQVDMVMSLTEPPSGIVGEEPELSIYPYELSGQLLIHKFEPPGDGADDEYDYLYSVELKNVILGRQSGTVYSSQVLINYASFCRSDAECVDTR